MHQNRHLRRHFRHTMYIARIVKRVITLRPK